MLTDVRHSLSQDIIEFALPLALILPDHSRGPLSRSASAHREYLPEGRSAWMSVIHTTVTCCSQTIRRNLLSSLLQKPQPDEWKFHGMIGRGEACSQTRSSHVRLFRSSIAWPCMSLIFRDACVRRGRSPKRLKQRFRLITHWANTHG